MGGHKQGGQGAHRHRQLQRRGKGGRNCHPDDRVALTRSLDAPGGDIKRAGARLVENKQKREGHLRTAKAGKRTTLSSDRHAFAAMALQAVKEQEAYSRAHDSAGPLGNSTLPTVEMSLKKYSKEFKSVIEASDVLLEVLDARDPLGCRLLEFEAAVQSQYGDAKQFVMVLNKADMVPDASVLDSWVKYFGEMGIPAVPFSATRTRRGGTLDYCVAELFRVLRKLARVDGKSGARRSLTVGVIGYPNVGKSSTINALKGKNVVGVGNTPGVTTGTTEVDLRDDIKIIDCPGVVVRGVDGCDVVLRNAAKLSDVEDPLLVVETVLQRCDMHRLCAIYAVPLPSAVGNPVNDFLRAVALKRGRVTSGGHLQLMEAAHTVLKDWNDGRIVHYTLPPESHLAFRSGDGALTEVGDAPELLTALAPVGPSVMPAFVVVAPNGASPAEWDVPAPNKFTGKIRYSYLDDTTSSEDDDDSTNSDDVAECS